MKRYFVTSVYRPCGTKKIEDMLFDISKRLYEHCIIHEDRLPVIAACLESTQQDIIADNRRLRPVDIKLWPESVHGDGYRAITLGQVHIQLVEVLAEYPKLPRTSKE